jgi:Holliday junction resolvasome RuvABC endonuclease subunit
MSRYLNLVVFLVGLAAVCWIGAGYVGSNTLALAVTMLVGACYLAGALELQRYSQATSTLARAVTDLSGPPPALSAWLDRLHPSLRNAVRLRVEGERVALPGPALAPYLVGLLVLLGMLGTLLGMVATLRGTGMALESATDLQVIRDSLAAPVKGLGFAFGTSIAGVAASAMLGLLSALCRRERIQAGQMLDVKIATTLRIYSQTHQREETFKLLQRQAEGMPELVDRLQMMMAAIEQQNLAVNARQIASQEAFHGKAEATYARLASSVERSLKESVADSTRAAGAALQPVMEATMAGLARETASLHATVTHAVQQQLEGLSNGFETSTTTVAGIWNQAVEGQQRSSEALVQQLRTSLDRFTETFEQRSTGLLEGVSARLDATAGSVSAAWNEALSRQERAGEKLASHNQQALTEAAATFEQHSASLLRTVGQSQADLQGELASRDEQRLAVWTETLGSMAATLSREWEQAGTRTASRQQEICDTLAQTARDISAQTQAHASNTIAEIDRLVQVASEAPKAAANLQAELASRDQQRLAAWTETLGSMATTLSREWEQAGTRTASRQQEICDTLERTARDISAQTQAHASDTIAEISRLVQAASEAPKAAAEVVAELRQKLSDSMVRDTAMLDERSRLLATLETLLDAVNHASTEQRSAVDALVTTSAGLLERVGTQFADKVETETGKLGAVAAQVTGSAVEVASLGEAFGMAVQLFGDSNEKLVTHLQRIEVALDKSLARSDEQLAYYVAQAREVIDLSMMSQKQIVEDLQQLAGRRASAGAAVGATVA